MNGNSRATSSRYVLPEARQNPNDNETDDFFAGEVIDENEAAAVREEAEKEEHAPPAASDDDADGQSDRDLYEDPAGSMYAGPMAASLPTSITRRRRKSRSRSELLRSDAESDTGARSDALFLSSGAKHSRTSLRTPTSRRSRGAGSRRGSESSAVSDATSSRMRSKSREVPPNAVESASESGSEDEEGGRKKKRRPGMLSALFGSAYKSRPSMDRAQSSASVISRRSSQAGPKRRKAHKHRHGSSTRLRDMEAETDAEDDSNDEIDENDPYGLYGSSSSSLSTTTSGSSATTTSSSDDGKSRRKRRKRRGTSVSGSMFLPSFGGADPVFGDSRADTAGASPSGSPRGSDAEGSDDEEPFFIDEITATRQTIYIVDEDLQILFEGWGEKTYKILLWNAGALLSLGSLSLLGKWLPEWWLDGRGKTREFGRASQVVVKTSHGTTYVVPIKTLTFASPVPISTVFPATSLPPPTSRNEAMEDSDDEQVAGKDAEALVNGSVAGPEGANIKPTDPPSGTQTPASFRGPISKSNGHGSHTPAETGSLRTGKEAKLKEYKYVDFRYYRFLLHPISGNFHMSR